MVPKITIGQIPVHLFNLDSLNKLVLQTVQNQDKIFLLNANAHLVQLANSEYNWLIDFFREDVDYVMCDGAGIQLAARLTRQPVPTKIAYNVWFWDFVKFCATNNLSLYLLGAKQEVVEKAAQNLQNAASGLNVHYHHGYFNKELNSDENKRIKSEINRVKPHILLVAFGMPLQEKWLKENAETLDVNIMMTAGGAFDFFAGKTKVAPPLVSRLYLEWLYRLVQEPKRLWRRYLVGNVRFLYYALKND